MSVTAQLKGSASTIVSLSNLTLKAQKVIRAKGLRGIALAIVLRAKPVKSSILPLCRSLVRNQHGLEIGGPSWIFSRRGNLPIYPCVGRLDNCNFGRKTIWEGHISEGTTFKCDKDRPLGRQYIGEAADLRQIPDGAYRFLLSSHTIEHTANPLGALREWMRILAPDGKLLLVVPHMEGTFDHRRPVTKLEHLMDDFRMGTREDDLTHLDEVLKLHDLDRDLGITDFAAFKERTEKNLEFRTMHHHVFDTTLVVAMLDRSDLEILAVEAIYPFHIIALAQKSGRERVPQNQSFLGPSADWRRKSPFQRDRTAMC